MEEKLHILAENCFHCLLGFNAFSGCSVKMDFSVQARNLVDDEGYTADVVRNHNDSETLIVPESY